MTSGGHSVTAVLFNDTMKHSVFISAMNVQKKNVFKSETHIAYLIQFLTKRLAVSGTIKQNCMKRRDYSAIPILSNF
jgi:hypothetical protein